MIKGGNFRVWASLEAPACMKLSAKTPKASERKAGQEIDIKYILDIRDFEDHEESHLFTKDFNDILNDDEVSVVIEVMGGTNPAYDFSKAALLAGKHVVTSNKELVATHGTELLNIAKEHNINYLFEASVGGGIPIIRPLNQCLAANEIEEIYGILNGTTNYILTKMIKEGAGFEEALKEAQEKGYAERNPSADVDGIDACRKIAILASLASGKFVDSHKILTEGISKLEKADAKYAEKMNCVIKLIGYAKLEEDGRVFTRVCPMLIPDDHQLSDVNGVFNAILVHGDSIGDVMFYGRGAGKLPTASAVVADVIDAVKHIAVNNRLIWRESAEDFLIDPSEVSGRYFVRTSDKACADRFSEKDIIGEADGEVAFTTAEMPEKTFMRLLDGKGTYIRML